VEEEEQPSASPKPYFGTAVHEPKFPQLLPARGPGRPHFRQVLSEPDLRKEFLGIPEGQSQVHANSHQGHAEYRQGLDKLLRGLDMQHKKRKARVRREEQTMKFEEEMQRQHKIFLESGRSVNQKPEWYTADATLGLFERPPLYEQGESKVCNRNPLLTGIFPFSHPHYKPAHHEKDSEVTPPWNYFQSNLRNEQLYEFKDKMWQMTPMSPGEVKYTERLNASIARMTEQTRVDALNKTTGSIKKDRLIEAAGDHSCLKRALPPWNDQAVTNHEFFGKYAPNKPGDVEYESGLEPFLTEPDRRTNPLRQIVVGANTQRKSFWKCPTEKTLGTNRRQLRAAEIAFRNQRGCEGLRPPSPQYSKKVLLKGTGSMSFTCFKDALVQPPFEAFAPTLISAPP